MIKMFQKKNRLVSKKDFFEISRFGRVFRGDHITIKVKQNGQGETKVGVVVGKKYSPKAVDRNLVKRQIKAYLRENIHNIKPGMDIVVFADRREEGKDEARLELEKALNKARILNN